MNFLNKLIKLKIILLICLFNSYKATTLLSNNFLSHFYPENFNITLPEQISNNTIKDIAFDNSGIIYISSGKSVYAGNGLSWTKINLNGKASLVTDNSLIYYFTENDAGLISKDNSGNFITQSFISQIEKYFIIPSEISALKSMNDTLYFKTGSKLYLLTNNEISISDNDFSEGKIFTANNEIILYKPEFGFKKKDKYYPSSLKIDFNPEFLIPIANGYMVYSKSEQTFFILDNNFTITKEWETAIEDIIYCGKLNNYFYFYTLNNYLYICSENGQLITELNYNPYLSKGSHPMIKPLYNKLWFIMQNKIYYLNFPPLISRSTFHNTGIIQSSLLKILLYIWLAI